MTGEECTNLFLTNLPLRQYIIDQARRHSSNREDQEDFVQEAWLRIFESEPDRTDDYYYPIAYRAIHWAYEKERRKLQTEISAQYI
jgi:DNA-directed RNA polymerase specialized sigma24 family protein